LCTAENVAHLIDLDLDLEDVCGFATLHVVG